MRDVDDEMIKATTETMKMREEAWEMDGMVTVRGKR